MAFIDLAFNALLPSLIILHLLIAPYTKVEESFNIQAVHDLLSYTPLQPLSTQSFDHFSFPGAVPRTFVGASILAVLSKPFVYFLGTKHSVFYPQLIVRGILGLLNAAALLRYKNGLERAFGRDVGRWWTLLIGSGFHVVFYASRTLPNMFAFGLTTLALRECLPLRKGKSRAERHTIAISLFVFAGVVFRAEVALLLVTQLAIEMLQSRITLGTIIPAGIKSAILALAISVPIDSYLWQRPVWPEFAGFYYNAIQGKSSDWGVSPYSFYMTSILPKLLLNPIIPIVLLPLGFALPATNQLTLSLISPSLLFISIYSLQPHKEARFIIYVIPPLIAAASLSATYIWKQRTKSVLYRLASLLVILSILASFAASTTMLLISSLNYPGGSALSQFHSILQTRPKSDSNANVYIHMDILSCMTGITQFQQYPNPSPIQGLGGKSTKVYYDKTEDAQTLADPKFWDGMDYALMEEPGRVIGNWDLEGTVWGYAGIEILKPGEVSGSGDPLEKVYAANNATKESGEVRSSEDVREAVEGVKASADGVEKVTLEVLRKRLLDGKAGKYEVLGVVRDAVRLVTGGWWVGPKMEPKIRILRNMRVRAGPGRERYLS